MLSKGLGQEMNKLCDLEIGGPSGNTDAGHRYWDTIRIIQKYPFQQRAVEAQLCHATWKVYAHPWTLLELLGHPKEKERDSEEKIHCQNDCCCCWWWVFLLFVWKKLLIYNDVLVSGIQESDSDHFRFLSIIDYYDIEYSSLCYTVDPCWVSVLYIVVSIF